MGMFDSFVVTIECPHSGKESEVEFQTKMFDCMLERWAPGDRLPGNSIRSIEYDDYGMCRCEDCMGWEAEQNKTRKFKCIGYGREVYATIIISNGIFVGVENVSATPPPEIETNNP